MLPSLLLNMRIKYLRWVVILSIVLAFVSGPTLSVGPLDLRLFDGVFVFLIFLVILFVRDINEIPLPKTPILIGTVGCYMSLALFLPIFGYVLYSYPLGYIVGDLRWVQAIVIGIAFGVIANGPSSRVAIRDLYSALKVIIIVQIIFVSLQLLYELNWFDTMSILQMTHSTDFHILRFGGTGSISDLGRLASIGFLFFSYSVVRNKKGFLYLFLSILLLLASGVRTSIVATSVLLAIVLLSGYSGTMTLSHFNWRRITVISLAAAGLSSLVYHFNIGRIQSDRYYEMFAIVGSWRSFEDISGRGGERWGVPIKIVHEHFAVGTLANPSWVFVDLPALDSYFLITYLQGGVIFITSFSILLIVLLINGIRIYSINRQSSTLSIGIVVIIAIHGVTQNLMTSLHAKLLLVLCIVLIFVSLSPQSCPNSKSSY